MLSIRLLPLLMLTLVTVACFGSEPLVEFSQKPGFPQTLPPGQTSYLYYTITNHTNIALPLTYQFSSPLMIINGSGTTCGAQIAGNSSCTLALTLTAPTATQTLAVDISVDYQGRTPLRDKAIYNVNSAQLCRLLSIDDYQTSFCQNQYQHIVNNTPNVFNIENQNVLNGQSVGGMIGVYQNLGTEQVCFVSCGLRELNGVPPNENTVYELASVTKTFTGSVLGKKVYNNQVNPLDEVRTSLPGTSWLGNTYSLNAHEQTVSFQQLATFSGGVCYSDAPSVVLTDTTLQKQADFVHDINLLNPTSPTCLGTGNNVASIYGTDLPTRNFYSNSSFGLVGQALMSIDGYVNMDQPDFNGWMCEHILTPLGMTRTNACLPSEALGNSCPNTGSHCDTSLWNSAEYAMPYHVVGSNYVAGQPFPFVPWAPAGNLRSNAIDMVKYIRANLGLTPSAAPDVVQLMHGMDIAHLKNNYLPVPAGDPELNIGSQNPLRGSQGYAWVCDPNSDDAAAICGKIGGHENFRSFVGFSRSKKYGVVILLNTGALDVNGGLRKSRVTIPSVATIGVNLIKATA